MPGLHVEQIVDLWPRIRQDVKALNRRIEALLLSVDPALVAGTAVTLSTPYPFHRDKLNSDDVRQVVETAISRIVGLPVQVTTELREDVVRRSEQNAPTTGNGGSAPIAPAASATPTTAPDRPTADDVGAQRVRAAMNIFDAEEID